MQIQKTQIIPNTRTNQKAPETNRDGRYPVKVNFDASETLLQNQKRRKTMLNKTILMGRLTKDPELRTTANGTSVASFSIAVEDDFKNPQTGEKDVDFFDCVAWKNQADFVSKYFSKGRMAIVEGKLKSRYWEDNSGFKRKVTELIVSNIYFGDSPKQQQEPSQTYVAPAPDYSSMSGFDAMPALADSDLPF